MYLTQHQHVQKNIMILREGLPERTNHVITAAMLADRLHPRPAKALQDLIASVRKKALIVITDLGLRDISHNQGKQFYQPFY